MSFDMLWQILTLLLLMCVGYSARKAGIIHAALQRGLSDVILHIALPASILGAAQHMEAEGSTAEIITVLIGAAVYFAVVIGVMEIGTRWLPLDRQRKAALRLVVVFSNCAFMGYPVLSVIYPEQGVFYGCFFVFIFHLVFFTYGAGITSGGKSLSVKSVVLNINNIASAVMLLLFLFNIRLPVPLSRSLELLGGLCTPLSMLVIGSMLAGVNIKRIFTSPLAYAASLLRLLVIPALIFAGLRALNIGGVAGTVLLVLSGMPGSSMAVIQAEKNNCAPETVANGVMLSTLLFIPAVFYLLFLNSLL